MHDASTRAQDESVDEQKATDAVLFGNCEETPSLDDSCTQKVATSDPAEIEVLPEKKTCNIVNRHRVNDTRYLNNLFKAINDKLHVEGIFIGTAETVQQRRRRILNEFPVGIDRLYYVLDFVFKRVFPKLPLTKQFYFWLTEGRNRVLSKAEILGRLVCCGFEIIEHKECNNRLHFVVRKTGDPTHDINPSYGPLYKMKRYGQGGKVIHVYKLRTMHPYAEYLQEYVYAENGLAETGKFENDFRVTSWGRPLRKMWIDELPMLINWLKGEMKLVGVRPLSEQYRSMYPSDFLAQRDQHQPGLLPPYYADLPEGFEEVVASERRYLEAYEERPVLTDIKYLLRALSNILFRGARSQ